MHAPVDSSVNCIAHPGAYNTDLYYQEKDEGYGDVGVGQVGFSSSGVSSCALMIVNHQKAQVTMLWP